MTKALQDADRVITRTVSTRFALGIKDVDVFVDSLVEDVDVPVSSVVGDVGLEVVVVVRV